MKIAIYAVVLGMIIGVGYWLYDTGYETAAAKCDVETEKQTDAEIDKKEKQARQELKAAIEEKQKELNDALQLIEDLRNRPEVPDDVIRKAGEASSCDFVGAEYVGVWNQIIGKPPVIRSRDAGS